MGSINIKLDDNKLREKLLSLSKYDCEDVVKKATSFVEGQAKALAPANTGTLRNSIHSQVTKDGYDTTGKVYTNLSYASYVEFGTGSKGNGTYPYKIKGLSLKYRGTKWTYTPDGGETFYSTNGQVAKPYMYPAFKQSKKYIDELIKNNIKEEVEK